MYAIDRGVTPGTLVLQGEIDLAAREELSAALDEAARSGRVAVDMGQVTFIDSSGLHVLMKTAATLNGSSPLILEHVPADVVRVLEIVGMYELSAIEIRTGD